MPPMRLLSKDFIGKLLSTENRVKPQESEEEENVETMEISDDENENSPTDEKIVKRKAMEKEEKSIRDGAKKKESVNNIENRMKNLKLDSLKDFDV
jgi:hypothetical protein